MHFQRSDRWMQMWNADVVQCFKQIAILKIEIAMVFYMLSVTCLTLSYKEGYKMHHSIGIQKDL